jgi:predicted permease
MDLYPILSSIITLFILIATGFAAYRAGIITRTGISGLSNLLVNITLPCLIIESMQVQMTQALLHNMEILAIIEVIVYAVSFAAAFLLPYLMKGSQFEIGVIRFMIIFSNLGFMGYPVCNALFGSESFFYVSLINIPFGLLVFTIGIYLLRPEIIHLSGIRQIATPGLCASVIGLLFFFLGVSIPSPFSDALSILGSVTTPLAMIVIGSLLATIPLLSMLGDVRIWIVSLARLILIPIAVFLVIRPFVADPLLLFVPVILAAMPVANSTVLLAEEYGVNAELASKGVFLSTLLSLATIPVVALLIGAG